MQLLNNKMFDDGSFECFNFWIADQDGTYQVEASEQFIQELKSKIEARMIAGHGYLDMSRWGMVFQRGSLRINVLEIQWG